MAGENLLFERRYAWPSGWQGIIKKMCETYVTIARGNNPEQAFWVAQTLGLNGREIQNKDGFLLFSVPEGARPMEFVFELLNNNSKLQSQSEMSGCVLLMQADPSAPDEHYFLSQKKNAYIFFGYEGGKEHA